MRDLLLLLLPLLATPVLAESNSVASLGEPEGVLRDERYKCLTCDRSADLMCFSNQTCEVGKKYCYFHIWEEFNTNLTKWDKGYTLHYREWGCTESAHTCTKECADTGCITHLHTCCDADLNKLSGNWSVSNEADYRGCYYGAAPRVGVHLGLLLALVTWYLNT